MHGAYASVVWTRSADYYRDKPWRGSWAGSGGGLLINQAIHTLDLLLWLLGPASEVHGVAANTVHPNVEVEDTATIVLKHAGGASSTLFATCLLYTSDAADERSSVNLGGRHTIKKKKYKQHAGPTFHINSSRDDGGTDM